MFKHPGAPVTQGPARELADDDVVRGGAGAGSDHSRFRCDQQSVAQQGEGEPPRP